MTGARDLIDGIVGICESRAGRCASRSFAHRTRLDQPGSCGEIGRVEQATHRHIDKAVVSDPAAAVCLGQPAGFGEQMDGLR